MFHDDIDFSADATKQDSIILDSSYQITQNRAIEIARDFALKEGIAQREDFLFKSCKLRSSEKILGYYEIEFISNNENGYTIITADKRTSEVICFVEKGALSDTLLIEPLKYFFRNIPRYLHTITKKNDNSQYKSIHNTKSIPAFDPNVWTYSTTVYDTCTTQYQYSVVNWGPGNPFNSLIGNFAGCTRVSVAQIMAFHKKIYSNYIMNTVTWNEMITNESHPLIPRLFKDLYDNIGTTTSSMRSFLENNSYTVGSIHNGYDFDLIVNALIYGPTIITGLPGPYSIIGHSWIIDGAYLYTCHIYDIYTLEYNGEILEYYLYHNDYCIQRLHYDWGYYGYSDGWFAGGVFDEDNEIQYDNLIDPADGQNYAHSIKIISYIN